MVYDNDNNDNGNNNNNNNNNKLHYCPNGYFSSL